MSKGMKITIGTLAWFVCLTAAHVWLNIGYESIFDFSGSRSTFKVGFLPVT
jgi:hypothetical protein